MNDTPMFCRQCQETFGNTGCTRGGMCGKRPETSNFMDVLVSGLEDLAKEAKPTKDPVTFPMHLRHPAGRTTGFFVSPAGFL